MKYALIIADGAADVPLKELEGRTPLEAADIPHIDRIAATGRLGTVRNIPDGMPAGSDVAILSVLGYDPREVYTGRAPLEAAAMGLDVADDEWVFRCNLVTVIDGIMEDYSAGHITSKEAAALIAELNDRLADETIRFHPGVSYRHIMLYRGACDALTTTPPHDILSEPVAAHQPAGEGADHIRRIMEAASALLEEHEINAVRRDVGDNPATGIWLWGQGTMPTLPTFRDKYGLTGKAITAVDLVAGISKLIGWQRIPVEGATGFVDTNYAGKGEAAVAALDGCDLVCVHVEAPDEAGHHADAAGKIAAMENIDRHVVAPLLERLSAEGEDWRILVLPDHPTPCTERTHTREAVPFALAGKGIPSVVEAHFTEADAARSDLHVNPGCELMEYFLTVR